MFAVLKPKNRTLHIGKRWLQDEMALRMNAPNSEAKTGVESKPKMTKKKACILLQMHNMTKLIFY
jgi:hypothetical protein